MQFNNTTLFKTPGLFISKVLIISGSQSMMARLATSSSPDNFWEMKILSPLFIPTESGIWGMQVSNLCLNKPGQQSVFKQAFQVILYHAKAWELLY